MVLKDQPANAKDKPAERSNGERFYNFNKFLVNTFSKKYKFSVNKPSEPTIYISRHLNMHAPITILKSANFKIHPFVIHNVLSFKECFLLFYNYTFSKKMKIPKIFAIVPAFFASLYAPLLCRSLRPVPVYRKSASSLFTIKKALEFLEKDKPLLIFPDVDYFKKDGDSDIYDGFLNLDKLYYKKHSKHINFVPLIIDEKCKEIKELAPITFFDGENFDEQKQKVACKIKENIFS